MFGVTQNLSSKNAHPYLELVTNIPESVINTPGMVHCPTCEETEIPILLINFCFLCLSFARCLLYSHHLSLVIGMLLCLVGLKECWLGSRSLGLGWPLSKVGTQFGAILFQSSPPHNSGMPSWSGDREHYTTKLANEG